MNLILDNIVRLGAESRGSAYLVYREQFTQPKCGRREMSICAFHTSHLPAYGYALRLHGGEGAQLWKTETARQDSLTSKMWRVMP
jgi:hypothetical protein